MGSTISWLGETKGTAELGQEERGWRVEVWKRWVEGDGGEVVSMVEERCG